MKEELYDDIFEDKEEQIDFKASLFKYIIRWPWFVASVIVCMACAWIYLKQSTPAYNINASILIKDEKKAAAREMYLLISIQRLPVCVPKYSEY